jgi:hypothetical protein
MHPSLRHHALERRAMDEAEFRGPKPSRAWTPVEDAELARLRQIKAEAKIVLDTYDEADNVTDELGNGDLREAINDLRKLIYPNE